MILSLCHPEGPRSTNYYSQERAPVSCQEVWLETNTPWDGSMTAVGLTHSREPSQLATLRIWIIPSYVCGELGQQWEIVGWTWHRLMLSSFYK